MKLSEMFKPAYLSSDRKKAMAAVEALTDDAKLYDAVSRNNDPDIRKAATKKIKDQDLLVKIMTGMTFVVPDEAFAKLDEFHSKQVVRGTDAETIVVKAVENIRDQDFLKEVFGTSKSHHVKAAAIRNMDRDHLDFAKLKEIAITAQDDRWGTPKDALAAIEKIENEDDLLEIALKAKSSLCRANGARGLRSEEKLAEALIRTNDKQLFAELAPKVREAENRSRIMQKARIRDGEALSKLVSGRELVELCLKNKAKDMVEGSYRFTWREDELKQLREICDRKDLQEKIDMRIRRAQHFEMLRQKGFPAVADETADKYIDAFDQELSLLGTVKKTVAKQGRSVRFDTVYEVYGMDLQNAVLSDSGISLIYFLGGPLMGGLMLMGPGIKLSAVADKAVWAVVAGMQLADQENVVSLLSPDMSREDAAKVIRDIAKLWFEKMC